jgi:hypothetical protein
MAIDFDPSLMFGVEYIFHPKWSFQQELGYGRYNTLPRSLPILGYEAEEPSSTFRARVELRRYLNSAQPAPRGRYLALEGFYRLTGQHYEGNVRLGGSIVVPYNLVLTNHMTGVHIKFGEQLGKKYLTDFFVGIGLRASFSTIPDRSRRAEVLEDILLYAGSFYKNNLRPSLALGFKLGLPWKGRR